MRWLMGSVLLLMVSQGWAGSLLGHVRLVDDKGLRQNPEIIAIGFRSLTAKFSRSKEFKIHRWECGNKFEPNILVIQPSDKVEIVQQGMPIKDLLVLGKSYAYRTGSRKRITSLDFFEEGYYHIEEHSVPGVMGRVYVEKNDFIVRPDKRGLLKLEDIPHGVYSVSIYNHVDKIPLKLEVTILEKETTALRINLNHKILRRES